MLFCAYNCSIKPFLSEMLEAIGERGTFGLKLFSSVFDDNFSGIQKPFFRFWPKAALESTKT